MVRLIVGLFGAGAMAAACGAQPPRELVAARTAYTTASSGGAAQLAPAQLEAARISLDNAELWYAAHGADTTTRELAIDAAQRANNAAAAASAAATTREQSTAAAIAAERSAAQRARASAEQARASAEQARAAAAREQAARTAAEQQRSAAEQERIAAEERERAAVESLRQVAMVREEQRGMVITLSGEVLFPSGESTLLPIARSRLDQVAQALREYDPRQTFTVEGYTDARGSYATNAALSQARAQAVLDYLVSRGVPPSRIRAAGYGPSRPIADNASPEGRANNRRVEIVVHPAGAASSVGGGPAQP